MENKGSQNLTSKSTTNILVPGNENLESKEQSAEVNDKGESNESFIILNEFEDIKTISVLSTAIKQSNLSKPSIVCRICLMNEDLNRLMTPCLCKGTHAFVHQSCLEHWLSRSGLSHCELCTFRFSTVDHLRYGMFESMRIWFSHPNNRFLLQSDILLCLSLTIITFGLVATAIFGMHYLTSVYSGSQRDLSRYLTDSSVVMFLAIVIFAFMLNTFVVLKANCVPWFRWWRRSREIELNFQNNNQNV